MRASMLAYLVSRNAGSADAVQQLKVNDCLRCLLHTSAAYHSNITPSTH